MLLVGMSRYVFEGTRMLCALMVDIVEKEITLLLRHKKKQGT